MSRKDGKWVKHYNYAILKDKSDKMFWSGPYTEKPSSPKIPVGHGKLSLRQFAEDHWEIVGDDGVVVGEARMHSIHNEQFTFCPNPGAGIKFPIEGNVRMSAENLRAVADLLDKLDEA